MRINTNMAALNAWRSMETNQSNLQKSLGRLSSGYRINTAADDAAGLAVSEKMTAQTRGIAMATRNAQDASSLVQTAEGGAGNIQDMLQRMRELAVQASSDSLQDSDRAQLQEEFSSLQSEIDRTAGAVQFNGRVLLDGTSGSKSTITGTPSGVSTATVTQLESSTFETNATQYLKVHVTASAIEQTYTGAAANDGSAGVTWVGGSTLATLFGDAGTGDVLKNGQGFDIQQTVNGKNLSISINYDDSYGGKTVRNMTGDELLAYTNKTLNDAGMAARMSIAGGKLVINSNIAGTSGDVTTAERNTGMAAGLTLGLGTGAGTGTGTDANVTLTWGTTATTQTDSVSSTVDYAVQDNTITGRVLGRVEGLTVKLDGLNTGDSVIKLEHSTLDFQVGANQGESISTQFADLRTSNLGVNSLDISTKTGASSTIDSLDTALSTVSTQRAKMGAMQNRLDNAISSLQTQSENLTAANSRIRDVDMAQEMAQFTKYQVLSQASTAMLAQANQLSQGILTLLR